LQLACIGLGLFNLFPALPLDGGQALRAVLWALSRDRHTAGFWAARIGQWAGSAMTIVGLMGYLSRDANQWIWLAVVGLLVEGGARAAYRQVGVERAIEGHVAADVMVRGCVPLSPDLTLDQLDGALARRSVPCLVVGDERGVYGMLTGSRIRRVRRSRRGRTTLMQVLLPIAEQHRVSPEMPLREVLERMFDSGLQELPVMRDGAMLGIAVHHEIVRLIESRSIGGLS